MLEVKSMFLECQLPDRVCFGRLLECKFSGFLDVFGCLKLFSAIFARVFVWLKSMLSRGVFLVVVSPVEGHYILGYVDGVKNVD